MWKTFWRWASKLESRAPASLRSAAFQRLNVERLEERTVLTEGQFTALMLPGGILEISAQFDENSLMVGAERSSDGVLRPYIVDSYRWDILTEEEKILNEGVKDTHFVTARVDTNIESVQLIRILLDGSDINPSSGKKDVLNFAADFGTTYVSVKSILIWGGGGDDTINGPAQRPSGATALGYLTTVDGGDGHDHITAGAGGKLVAYGGKGNDTIRSEAIESSKIYGDVPNLTDVTAAGDDTIWGGNKRNEIYGGGGQDYIDGRGDADTFNLLHGNDGHDSLVLGKGWGDLFGDAGPDDIYAEESNTQKPLRIFGGAGDDYIAINNAAAKVDGGTGHLNLKLPGKLPVGDDNAASDWHPTIGAASASKNVALRGEKVILKAENVTDTQGPSPGVARVDFYYDVDNDGKWDPNKDTMKWSGTLVNGRWEFETPAFTTVGRFTFFAVATDNNDYFGKAEKIVIDVRPPGVGFMGFDHFDHVVQYEVVIPDFDEPKTVDYAIVSGSAELGQHFDLIDATATSANTGTITFAAHQTVATISLHIRDFAYGETGAPGDRDFAVVLVDGQGDELFTGEGLIRSFTYRLGFSGSGSSSYFAVPTFDEDDYSASGFVYLSAMPFEGVDINARTEEQITYDNLDIAPFSGILHFNPGQTESYFPLGIIDDNIYERLPESFDGYIDTPKAGIIAPGYETGTFKIRDNDPMPTLIVDDVAVTVGGAVIFQPRLSNPSAETIVIEYLTYDGSAQEGTDYIGGLGYWNFFAGQTVGDLLSVATIPDYQAGTKEFYLTYMSSDFVQVNGGAVGTILDGQEWVEGYWAGNYEYQNLGHMVSHWVGTHWVEDYYVAGHWDGGNWVEGILTGGDWVAGHYEGGTWVDGHYDGSDWVDAHYEGGTFIGGHYDGGTFVSGYYENGAWVEGAWLNDQWVDGHYEGGTFVAGHMEGQVLVPGHMEGQEFVAGHMENQTLIPGHNETPWIDAVYDENGDLVTAGHDGDPYWVDDAWVGGNWVDDAWVGGTWVDDAWTGGTWVDDQWIDQTWVDGYYALQQWIEAHYQQIWIDDHWEGQFWVDDHWENQTWIEGYFANQTWIDAHWENQAWVDGYWINQTWTDGHWENQTWVDAYTAGHWADDYVDEWVDDWQYVWVDLYVEGHWITT